MRFQVGVVCSAAAIVVAILIVYFGESPRFLQGSYTVFVTFPEAPGVTVDTPVHKSGIRVGRVSDIQLREDSSVLVTLTIDGNRRIGKGEICRIGSAGILGDAKLEFVLPSGVSRGNQYIGDQEYMQGVVGTDPLRVMEMFVRMEPNITHALASIQGAGEEVSVAARNMNAIVLNNRDQIQRIMQTSERAMNRFEEAMDSVNKFVGDEDLRESLQTALQRVPIIMQDASELLSSFQSMAGRAEQNLQNLEGLTRPLGERGPELVEHIDQTIQRVDQFLGQLIVLTESINESEGTFGQLLHNRELYDRLTSTVANIEELTGRLRPVVENANIISDKLARNPGRIISGALNPNRSGLKWMDRGGGPWEFSSVGTMTDWLDR